MQCDEEEFDDEESSEENFAEDFSTDGLSGGSEPGGNGQYRADSGDGDDDQIPY